MSTARIWTIGTVALVLVLLISGWTLGISPTLASVSAAQAQAATIRQSNVAGQTQLASLQVQYKGIAKLKKSLDKLRGSIPEDEGASAFLNEIATLCGTYGVTLTTITLANATLYVDPAAAAAAAAAPAPTSTDTPAPAATTAPAATPATTPAAGTNGLVIIPVSIVVKGNFDAVRDFADAAQNGERLLYASQIEYATTSDGTSATITGDIFALQGTSDSAPVKVKTLPNSTATPTPTMTPTPTPTPTKSTTTSGTKSGSTTPSTAPTTDPTTDPTPDPDPTS
jgi:Tfp pilus assembly protein PilO